MRLTEILQPDCVKVHLENTAKQAAINELAELLSANTPIDGLDDLKRAIWQRETTRTTGIGHGIAIPHGKTDGVDTLRMAIGVASEPIEFGAIDGKPVDLIILLVSPNTQTGPHIQALARISRMLTDEDFRNAIKSAKSGDELFKLIQQHETQAV